MRYKFMLFLLALFLFSLATPGFPANLPGAITLSPFVGGYTFDSDQELETSPVFGLRGGYNFTANWGAEALFSYVLTESNRTNREADVYRYGVDVLYHFMPESNFVPFIAAGFGGISYNTPSLPGHTDGLVNFGGGLKYFVADWVALRADVRDLVDFSGPQNNLEYTVGLTFQLDGKKPARVAQTAPIRRGDTTTPIVTLAVPFNGNVDIPIYRKMRVAFSEEMDPSTINSRTFTLRQGTTHVPGKVIVTTGTTASFTQESNLLPGTLYTATITTGVKDLAGNPMASSYVWSFTTSAPEKAEVKTIIIDKFVLLEDTHFDFDKATLTKTGEAMLKQNIQILKDNPKLKVRIAGYTSAQGTPEYNQRLSERRADTVMTYLINEGGIAPGRLETIGYGERRPAIYEEKPEDIGSKAAKANMRVLFEVIVK